MGGLGGTRSGRNHIVSEEVERKEKIVLNAVREGKSFNEAAELAGYTQGNNARKAYLRAIARSYQPDVTALRQEMGARLEDQMRVWFFKALTGDDPAELNAYLRLETRIAALWGLDHEHGVQERMVQIEADRIRLQALAFGKALDAEDMPQEQRQRIARRMVEALREHAAPEPEPAELSS